ncbi:DUF4112 domain-containing protein [Nitrosomonas eutropha]|uniref:Uncharacterized protein DUF4112 n=2 Tax=Nitrosomonas eutropha TaxID=916 RepID=A0ABX5M2Z9_9PROT|nr:DUF4112 domain-containing protein [Nitrosomonas eutropha]ABI59570.1 conserved hypothetical protein [Nitrosomonas eutropha C91]PXV72149.1 uncharacterized protein DUF4112 [Nitrosomonas eutropha]
MKTGTSFVERMGWFLDESITLPNGYKIGWDGFISLIPGVGDFISSALSSLIIFQAHQLGLPRMVLGRMLINLMIDAVVGAIPVAGDAFDFVWKANKRNLILLNNYQQQPTQVYRKSTAENILFILVLLSALALTIAFVIWILSLFVAAIKN